MRKMNPNSVRTDFAGGLDNVIGFYTEAEAVLTGDRDKTLLVESTFLSAAVLWEGFISDLFLAYINRDATQFAEHLRASLREGLRGKQRLIFDDYGGLTVPRHLTKDAISNLIDPNGGNVAFRNYAEMIAGANRWLTDASKAGIVSRTAGEQATVSATIAIRNHIAHRSSRSHTAMNEALGAGGLHNTGLQRPVNGVNHLGKYLKSRPNPNGPPRVQLYLTALRHIASQL